MANLYVNDNQIKGPLDQLERLKTAIEQSVEDKGAGYNCAKQFWLGPKQWQTVFPEWGDFSGFFVESQYTSKCQYANRICSTHETCDDGQAVRIVNGTLIIKCVSAWDWPVNFLCRLGTLFPQLVTELRVLDGADLVWTEWIAQAGEFRLVGQYSSARGEILVWRKEGKDWTWSESRAADIEMMCDFLATELSVDPTDLLTACWLAYDTIAFPGDTVPKEVTEHVLYLAREIAEHRHIAARTPRWSREAAAYALPGLDDIDPPLNETAFRATAVLSEDGIWRKTFRGSDVHKDKTI